MQIENLFTFRASDGNTVKLEYRESLPSAALLAKEYAAAGVKDRYIVFTEKQTAFSALGTPLADGESEKGIYISCILRPSIFHSQAGLIGPLSALAFASALEEHSPKKFGIGWVSDIYCEGRKIGGCHVEGKLDNFTSYEYLIINFAVKTDPKNFPPRLTDMVRQVFEDGNASVGMIMAKTVINRFFNIYRDHKNPTKNMDKYKELFILTGKKVKYIDDGKRRSAKVLGINKESCTLHIELKDGKQHFISSPSLIVIPDRL